MKKFSNKGFVLAETIVVAVFMVTIFSALYANYFPIMANYEKREYYDDIDSKYIAFWLKYMLQDPKYNLAPISSSGYEFFNCSNINDATKKKACVKLVNEAGLVSNPYCKISRTNPIKCKDRNSYKEANTDSDRSLYYVAIITNYNIKDFKTNLTAYNNDLYEKISDGMIDYINSLPDYNNYNPNDANYRIIIELYDNREPERDPIYKYSNIEVTK